MAFMSIDVDENETIANEHDVDAMPMFVCFKNGKATGEKLLGADKGKLHQMV